METLHLNKKTKQKHSDIARMSWTCVHKVFLYLFFLDVWRLRYIAKVQTEGLCLGAGGDQTHFTRNQCE